MIDKLMDMCDRHAPEIAELWYKSLSTNPRTSACLVVPKEVLVKHAIEIYRSIADMYFVPSVISIILVIIVIGAIIILLLLKKRP
jgi:hypothetical protein